MTGLTVGRKQRLAEHGARDATNLIDGYVAQAAQVIQRSVCNASEKEVCYTRCDGGVLC